MLNLRPGETLRELAGEPSLILGGPRALLMQIAHPKIAAGVMQHSDFRQRPWKRLWHTLDAVVMIVFGDERQAREAIAATRRTHDRIQGRIPERAGRCRPGARYSAHDAGAQAWVLCTLADTTEVVFERFVRPLHASEKRALWRDWRLVGRRFGTPARALPEGYEAYREYLEQTLEGDELEVTAVTRALAESVSRPRVPFLPRAAWTPAVSLTTALLPQRMREWYGLAWGVRQRTDAFLWTQANRAAWRLTPRARRRIPRVYATLRRAIG